VPQGRALPLQVPVVAVAAGAVTSVAATLSPARA
jgi:hypothetical protein